MGFLCKVEKLELVLSYQVGLKTVCVGGDRTVASTYNIAIGGGWAHFNRYVSAS